MPDSTRYKVLKNSDSEDDFELDHRQLRSRGQLPSNLPSSMRERNSTTTAFGHQNNNSPKSSNKQHNNTHYLEYTIDHKNNDTLEKISLEFRCDINELKRCNNIQTDIAFHALKTLKIPVSQYSSLIQTGQENYNNDDDETDNNLKNQPVRTNSPQSDQSSTINNPIGKILRNTDKEIQKIKKDKDIRENALEAVMDNIQNGFTPPLLPPIDRERFSPISNEKESVLCNWKVMLTLVILGLLILPFLYGYQFEKEHENQDRDDYYNENKYPNPHASQLHSKPEGIT